MIAQNSIDPTSYNFNAAPGVKRPRAVADSGNVINATPKPPAVPAAPAAPVSVASASVPINTPTAPAPPAPSAQVVPLNNSPVSVASASRPLTTPGGVPIVGPTSTNAQGNTFVDGTLNPTAGDRPPDSYYYGNSTPPATAASATPIPSAAGVSLSSIDPSSDLRSQLITPGPATDRYAIAQDQLKNYNDATQPYYQSALRDATSQAAGAGQLGSGQLRTSLGNLANQRNLQLETQGNSFLNDALTGSINDAYTNVGIAQQQQGFQAGQQNQSFNQGLAGTQLGDNLLNSSTNRGLATLNAGNYGSPSDVDLTLANLYGNQATDASNAASSAITNSANNASQDATNKAIQELLARAGYGQTQPGGSIPTGVVAPDNPNIGPVA